MGQIQFTTSLVLIALFAFAILGFSINFASDNNSNISLSNDPELNELYYSSNDSLLNFSSGSQSTYNSIVDTTIEPTSSGTSQSSGPFAITPGNVVGVVKNILQVGYQKIFGTGAGFGIFITAFTGLLVFIIGLLIWKTWAGRNPE